LRRPVIFGAILGLTFFMSVSPDAHARDRSGGGEVRWDLLSPDEHRIIDRIAADFYEETLRQAQSGAIEDQTSEIYRTSSPEERARFRAMRRIDFRSMNDRQKEALRGVKRPAYRNLTENQKTPFRRHAIDQLGAADAIDANALAQAFGGEI